MPLFQAHQLPIWENDNLFSSPYAPFRYFQALLPPQIFWFSISLSLNVCQIYSFLLPIFTSYQTYTIIWVHNLHCTIVHVYCILGLKFIQDQKDNKRCILQWNKNFSTDKSLLLPRIHKTSQELRMLSSATILIVR